MSYAYSMPREGKGEGICDGCGKKKSNPVKDWILLVGKMRDFYKAVTATMMIETSRKPKETILNARLLSPISCRSTTRGCSYPYRIHSGPFRPPVP